MDEFTRVYSIILAGALVIALVLIFYESPTTSRLNGLLSDNADVASYPYEFRVLGVDNRVATMTSPRSADFPAHRALAILFPALRNELPDSPATLDAQQEMARVQGIAKDIVVGSGDVDRVVWQLDEKWLRREGIEPSRL